MIDPVTYEVIRHRLTTIVEEGAIALRNTSGSPTVAMSGDCNVALIDTKGEGVLIGRMHSSHALSSIVTVRYILQEYQANPGFGPDDLFVSNDPYISTRHQNCVVVVGPVYADGVLVGWSGAGTHVGDIGGPIPGQVSIGAQSIWEEPSRMPPIRLVERGIIRKDLEQDFLSRSRTPLVNAMDMRSMIAANTTINRRLLDVVGRYGAGAVGEVMERMLDVAESRVRAILRELPDGQWEETGYLDYHDRGEDLVYVCHVRMVKAGEELHFDFSGSSPQAPAVINASMNALRSIVLSSLISVFSHVIGTSPGPLLRIVRVTAPPGSIVNCSWPAGLCKGSSSVLLTARCLMASCISRMMSASEKLKHRAFVVRGHLPTGDIAGNDVVGSPYTGVLPRTTQALGSGARYGRDGIDTGGTDEPQNMIPNVETNELRYPVLFLYQREAPDTAGPGTYRGGAAPDTAYIVHDVASIPDIVFHAHGMLQPTAPGIFGGYPGSTNELVILRESDVRELLAAGRLPTRMEEIRGTPETPRLFGHSWLGEGDVYFVLGCGGGGYGDPLDREADRVAEDVRKGVVSREWAHRVYGVALTEAGAVDPEGTGARRDDIRGQRRRQATLPGGGCPAYGEGPAREAHVVGRINDHLSLVRLGAGEVSVRCRCGHVIGPEKGYEQRLAWREVDCSDMGPHYMRFVPEPFFRLKERYCPSCYLLLDVQPFPLATDTVQVVAPLSVPTG